MCATRMESRNWNCCISVQSSTLILSSNSVLNFSFSIGPTALFLLETSKPIDCQHSPVHEFTGSNTIFPVFLQHGDIVIMAGKSRLARHAVPNIFFNDIPNVVLETAQRVSHKICESVVHEKGNDSCLHCQEFLQYAASTRINMNVRQVMPVNE
ncbi:unnamed protein product [Trichobilharzia regenti]|nr:unnamed protein product [Trichobilharzia regenti]